MRYMTWIRLTFDFLFLGVVDGLSNIIEPDTEDSSSDCFWYSTEGRLLLVQMIYQPDVFHGMNRPPGDSPPLKSFSYS